MRLHGVVLNYLSTGTNLSSIFWDMTPCRLLKVEHCLTPAFTLIFSLSNSSTLKMEETHSSETSMYFQQTTRRYIPEDRTRHNHRCENLKFYKDIVTCQRIARQRLDKQPAIGARNNRTDGYNSLLGNSQRANGLAR
jgi:hypothetical protein